MELRRTCCYLLATVSLGVWSFPEIVTAQITSDGSLSTTVSTDDAVNFLIENGDRSGSNLFHSFSEFSIPNLGSAYFDNATDITNIFSRVTGGNISDIQGLIRANGTANLFLINPAGIVFGENASLDVGGSFFATTAESVVFGDDIEFSAIEPKEAPLLTINITPGLQMGANPGDITVNNTGHQLTGDLRTPITNQDPNIPTIPGLEVNSGNTLALVGGNLTLDGGVLTVPSGRVELSAIGNQNTSSQVGLQMSDGQWRLTYDTVEPAGNLQFLQQALVDASGTGQGTVQIRAGNLTMKDGSIIWLEDRGSQAAGAIDVNIAETIDLIGFAPNTELASGIYTDVISTGRGSDLNVNAGKITFQEGGNLQARTQGSGDSGTVTVNASSLEFYDSLADNITGVVGSRNIGGSGNGNDVTINTERIQVDGGGAINASVFFGTGNGGNLVINATESIELTLLPNNNSDAIISASAISPQGNAGNITINTPRLSLKDGAFISSSTFGAGNSGRVEINASEIITLDGTGFDVITATVEKSNIRTAGVLLPEFIRTFAGFPDQVTGSGGEIVINTPRLEVTDGAEIAVSHDSAGDAGTIQINADSIFLDNQGQITADTTSGEGGNVYLTIRNGLLLRNGSTIITEAGGTGNGGNIAVNSDLVTLLENSQINANAFEGNGGNIIITTQGLFVSPNSSITASSQFGVDGTITLNTPDEENKLAIAELPANFTDASQQIVGNCSWTRDNTFYVVGRRGIAKTPQEHIQDYTMWSDIRDLSGNQSSARRQKEEILPERIIEANAWIINERGNVELVAVVPNNNQNLGQVASSCRSEIDS